MQKIETVGSKANRRHPQTSGCNYSSGEWLYAHTGNRNCGQPIAAIRDRYCYICVQWLKKIAIVDNHPAKIDKSKSTKWTHSFVRWVVIQLLRMPIMDCIAIHTGNRYCVASYSTIHCREFHVDDILFRSECSCSYGEWLWCSCECRSSAE